MKQYNFISWNVNGIRAVHRKKAFDWLDANSVDMLSLQEIKATKEQIPSHLFNKDYKFMFVSSSKRTGRDGVALFTDIEPQFYGECKKVDVLEEGRINEFHFKTTTKDIAFFNVYFPNGQMSEERLKYKLEFYDRFLIYLQSLRKSGKSIIFCGDVNTAHKEIDLKRPKANEKVSGFLPVERAWIDKLVESGYIDTFRYIHGDVKDRYTWWSYRFDARKTNAGWRIDYFFVSDDLKENIIDSDILDTITGSDHCPISLKIEL